MAVQLKYNKTRKRYDVLLPFTLEDEKLTLHRDLRLRIVQQILLKWDERVHMETVRDKRASGEFDELFNDNKKGDK